MIAKNQQYGINLSRVLRTIRYNRGISRTDIAKKLGLNQSTITRIVTSLLDREVVKAIAEGEASSSGGRKPIKLALNNDFGCILGFELLPDYSRCTAINLEGDIISSRIERIKLNASNLTEGFINLVKKNKKELEKTVPPIIAIGVGLQGMINPEEGKIIYSIPLNIKDNADFFREISERIDIPILIENNSRCCCWAEIALHGENQLRNFLFVLGDFQEKDEIRHLDCGTALGLGIVINGKVYHGEDYYAGEFRSLFWSPPNSGQFSLSDEESFMVKQDINLFKRLITEMSQNLALLVNTLDLNPIFIGGEIEEYRSVVTPIIEEEIRKNQRPGKNMKCNIKYSSLGKQAVSYGAAGMVLEHIFAIPDLSPGRSKFVLGWPQIFNRVSKDGF